MSKLTAQVSVKLSSKSATCQVFYPETCRRSAFQVAFLSKVADKEDFDHFVTVQFRDGAFIMHPGYASPCNVLWYDKAGVLHCQRVGATRLIGAEVVASSAS